MHKFIYLFLLSGLSINTIAQDPISYLAKPLNSADLVDLISTIEEQDTAIEIFQPTQKTMKLDYHKAGISMEYSTSMALYRMVMYDSGYTFDQYKGKLPLYLAWNMTQPQIEKQVGMLEIVDDNPFKKQYSAEDYIIELYFTNGRLSILKTTATYENLMKTNDLAYNSWGFRLLPDGKKLEGNVIDGVGTMKWGKNAAVYKGDWAYGLPHGQGEYVDSLGNKYQGEFKLGFFWGTAKFYSKAQGYSYDGEFVMGKRHGNGKLRYSTGQSYKGNFFQDYMHGQGQFVMNANYLYTGEMQYNTITGKGTLSTNQGSIVGTFKDGKPNGYCEQRSLDESQVLKGNWINGSKEGKFTLESMGNTTEKLYENNIEIKSGPIKN